MSTPVPVVRALPGLAGAVLAWLTFHAIASEFLGGMPLGLGSFQMPTTSSLAALSVTSTFATLGALALTHAGWHLLTDARRDLIRVALDRASDRQWVLLCAVVSAMLAAQVRTWILRDGPIADDESAYELAARILLLGRVWIPSYEDAIFFENVFLVNDGRFYTQYPLGWPALMAPFAALGLPGYANAFYSALTAPAVFLATRELLGVREARLASALYSVSPMHVIGAATAMSHTTCTMALAWLLVAVLNARRENARAGAHVAVSLAFCLMFFIRPSVAVGAGGPLLVVWALDALRRRDRGRVTAAFVIPSMAFAALFFAINTAQTGFPTKMAYVRALEFIRETGYRFTSVTPNEGLLPNLEFGNPLRRLATIGAALLRLDHDLLAWPLTLVLLPLAPARRGLGPVWASAGGMLAVHAFSANVGIDRFAPVHFFELGIPTLILVSGAIGAISDRLRDLAPENVTRRAALPLVATAALTVAALSIAIPPRLAALASIAESTTYPRDSAAELGVHRAIVFATQPYASTCLSWPNRHWVFFRPNNPPDLDSDVLWVNHVTIEEDRRFASRFADRDAYRMIWSDECHVRFVPLDAPDLDGDPPSPNLPASISPPREDDETRRND